MSHEPVNAQIMGQSYVLSAPSEEVADLRAAVSRVDEAMCRIRDAGKVKARDRIAVLAALNVAFEVSERSAAPAFEASGFASAELPASGAAADSNGAPDARLTQILQRLDRALGEDGRLL